MILGQLFPHVIYQDHPQRHSTQENDIAISKPFHDWQDSGGRVPGGMDHPGNQDTAPTAVVEPAGNQRRDQDRPAVIHPETQCVDWRSFRLPQEKMPWRPEYPHDQAGDQWAGPGLQPGKGEPSPANFLSGSIEKQELVRKAHGNQAVPYLKKLVNEHTGVLTGKAL